MKFLKNTSILLLWTSVFLNILLGAIALKHYIRAEENIVNERTMLWIGTELHQMKTQLRMPSKLMAKLLPAVGYHETRFRNVAGDGGKSHGFYQVRVATANDILEKTKLTIDDLYNPYINPFLAVEYLELLNQKYRNVNFALSAYNGGLRKDSTGYIAINQATYVVPILLSRYAKDR